MGRERYLAATADHKHCHDQWHKGMRTSTSSQVELLQKLSSFSLSLNIASSGYWPVAYGLKLVEGGDKERLGTVSIEVSASPEGHGGVTRYSHHEWGCGMTCGW